MAALLESRIFITKLLTSIPRPSSTSPTTNPLQDISPNTKDLLMTLHAIFPNEFLPALDLLDRQLLTRLKRRIDDDGDDKNNNKATMTENKKGNDSTSSPHAHSNSPRPSSSAVPATDSSSSSSSSTHPPLYLVRSARPSGRRRSSGSRFHDAVAAYYEVRPLAWNCSCPAFAFSAHPAAAAAVAVVTAEHEGSATAVAEDEAHRHHHHHHGGNLVTDFSKVYEAQWSGEPEAWVFGGLGRGGMTIPVCKHLLACVLVERVDMFKHMVEEKEVDREELAGWAAGWSG